MYDGEGPGQEFLPMLVDDRGKRGPRSCSVNDCSLAITLPFAEPIRVI